MTAEPATLGALFRDLRRRLEQAGIPGAALDARLLTEAATGCDHALLIARPETPVAPEAARRALGYAARRLKGEPVFRILGWREFRGLRLALAPQVLEPRPDTETLVELALPVVRAAAQRHGNARILDLGTGSGAIVLALLAEEPRAEAVATDISDEALATALANARRHGLADRLRTVRSDWFAAVEGKFHAILSNPPYIRTEEIAGLAPEVRLHDPLAALDGGADGLEAYRKIAAGAGAHLEADGYVLVEIGQGQETDVESIFARSGLVLDAEARDLAGITRALRFRAPDR